MPNISFNHVRLSAIDEDNNLTITYFMSTPMDVKVDSNMNKVLPGNRSALPAGTTTLEDIVSKMGVLGFKNEVSFDTLTVDFQNDIRNMKRQIDDLLYHEIDIKAFNVGDPLVRMGQSLSTISFSWELNKDPVSLRIAAGSRITEVEDLSSRRITDTYAIPVTDTTVFTMTAIDERDFTAEKTVKITFANDIYWGISEYLNWVNFSEYQHSVLSNGIKRQLSLNVPDRNYVYYAMPTRLRAAEGEPRFFVGGFEGGFIRIPNTDPSIDYTCEYRNSAGFTEPYDVYRSTNEGFGDIVMDIK